MNAIGSIIVAFVFGVIGAFFTFVPPQTIRSLGLDFARHDDRVLIGVLAMIIAVVAVYKLLTLLFGQKARATVSKNAAKPHKSRKRRR